MMGNGRVGFVCGWDYKYCKFFDLYIDIYESYRNFVFQFI